MFLLQKFLIFLSNINRVTPRNLRAACLAVMLTRRTFFQLTMFEIPAKKTENSKESHYFKSCSHKEPSKNVEAMETNRTVNPALSNK